ncbi:ComF family protein [Dongia sp.]|uniref:ComF family protein n=1 Tax=Dongia sp. TaxID=1977262 RepID=UPI0035B3C89B
MDMQTRSAEALKPLRIAGRRMLDAILPPRCLKCGDLVEIQGGVCPSCWQGLRFISAPACACCGLPFEFDQGPGALCASCAATPPVFDRARAVFRYDENSRDLILAFKHADRTSSAPAFANWLARAGAELLAEADFIAPVPLHWSRLFTRRYNQAALLSLALGRLSGKKVVPDLLIRRRATPKQGRLGRLARQRNVAGAFALNPRRHDLIAGRRILLIDDVVTTGATIAGCARALRQNGAGGIDVLALARVIAAD